MSTWRPLPIGQATDLAGELHALDWSWSMHDAHTIAEFGDRLRGYVKPSRLPFSILSM